MIERAELVESARLWLPVRFPVPVSRLRSLAWLKEPNLEQFLFPHEFLAARLVFLGLAFGLCSLLLSPVSREVAVKPRRVSWEPATRKLQPPRPDLSERPSQAVMPVVQRHFSVDRLHFVHERYLRLPASAQLLGWRFLQPVAVELQLLVSAAALEEPEVSKDLLEAPVAPEELVVNFAAASSVAAEVSAASDALQQVVVAAIAAIVRASWTEAEHFAAVVAAGAAA